MGRKRKQFPLYEEPDAKLARADSEGDLSENDDGGGDLRSGDEEFRGVSFTFTDCLWACLLLSFFFLTEVKIAVWLVNRIPFVCIL